MFGHGYLPKTVQKNETLKRPNNRPSGVGTEALHQGSTITQIHLQLLFSVLSILHLTITSNPIITSRTTFRYLYKDIINFNISFPEVRM